MKIRGRQNSIAIIDEEGRKVSYEELWIAAEKMKKTVAARSLLFILCDNSFETLSFYFKTMYIKAVPLLLSSNIDYNKLKDLINIYKPEFVWVKKKQGFHEGIGVLETNEHELRKMDVEKKLLNKDLGLLLMTSGSTGNSRIVRISYRNIKTSIKAGLGILPINKDDRYITALAMNFTYGLAFLHIHWYVGATVLATNHGVFTNKFWDFFEKEKPTNFAGVSHTYKILKSCGFLKCHYPYLRFINQGGDKMPVDLLKQFIHALPDVEFYTLYGQTEGTVFLCGHNCSTITNSTILTSVGKPLGDCKVEIRDKDSSGIGEIYVLGDTVSMGYADTVQDLELGDVNNGVLATGDLGNVDKEGNVYIQGRRSRFLKLMGTRVNLDDIEVYVKQLNPDLECACSGEDDNLTIYHTNKDLDFREMQNHVSEFIHMNEGVIKVRYIDMIPKTLSGKIDYGKLKNLP